MSPANRYQSSMANLAQALASGLDPQQGFSIWNDLESQHAQTLAAQQTQLDSLRQLAVQRAQQGVPFDQVQTEFQGLMPHMSQKLSMGIDDTLTSLYPGAVPNTGNLNGSLNGMSTLAPPAPAAFDVQDRAAIFGKVQEAVSATQPNDLGQPVPAPVPLHNVKAELQALLGPQYTPEVDQYVTQIYPMLMDPYAKPPVSPSHIPMIGGIVGGTQALLGSPPNRLGY